MRVVFLGKCKRSAAAALEWLVAADCEVPAVVAADPDRYTRDDQRPDLVAARHGIPLVSEGELYAMVARGELRDVDLVISFLFWNRIREPLISLGAIGCLNFHPAPLPDFRGVGGYNVAILEGLAEWGVSCHFVDRDFDTGDLVAVERFAIDPDSETALSLDSRSQQRLLELFKRVMAQARDGQGLPRAPQGEGRYVSRAEFNELRAVRPGDDLERKLRAFWYPPWPGAEIEVAGRRFTLLDERLLEEVAVLYRDHGPAP